VENFEALKEIRPQMFNWTYWLGWVREQSETFGNAPYCPISALGSNFNPRNTQCMSACPVGPADRTGVAKIFAFLELEQK